MLDKIKLNKEKINRFDFNKQIEKKDYQMAAAIAALDTTNNIQLSYFNNKENLTRNDHILRLYALLQGLFVSIDSLYALAYALTNSKSFININNNPDLRNLKYIRNDVVGHPSNRVIGEDALAYCILDNDSITVESFKYYIYSQDEIKQEIIDVNAILESYYNESNALLDELYKIAISNQNSTSLEEAIEKVLDDYNHQLDYESSLLAFIKLYKEIYLDSNKSQHRVLWRFDLIDLLHSYRPCNSDEADVINYCIGLEIGKIYQLINKATYKIDFNKATPKYISAFYRFLNKNKHLVESLNYLKGTENPLFYSTLKKLKREAAKKNSLDAANYLEMIMAAYQGKNYDLAYSLALPIKEYKKNK
ncbi:MAG: hypothetical protein IJY14_00315 [Acholeplasmatales bacterium]|nr:hypothetical protein [Acholeplasmatales bacterium]